MSSDHEYMEISKTGKTKNVIADQDNTELIKKLMAIHARHERGTTNTSLVSEKEFIPSVPNLNQVEEKDTENVSNPEKQSKRKKK